MAVRIGINPITWSNDDLPELGGETPLETCLAEAREAGYVGIELGNKFPRESAVLRPILYRHGLALISGWYSARLLERTAAEEIRAVEPHLSLLSEMGSAVMVFAETTGSVAGERGRPLSRRPRLSEADWPRFAERLTAVADHLVRRGVRMAYHHHMGTVVESEAEIDRLMRSTGESVGLLLDTGHLAYAGADPVAVAKRHIARINHVHCKDVRADVLAAMRGDDRSFLDAVVEGVFTVPGDGAVDFAAVLGVLKTAGYQGWLVVEAEQDPAKAHPLTYARMGCRYLSGAVRAAGL
ncbi:MAG TPA: myo-inosose-2 dehydratase [Stellaceae bacterium]|jgi:inosose dehydratase|nr:myo-inosose-2 dehydratase [Stellaceae bacterium]